MVGVKANSTCIVLDLQTCAVDRYFVISSVVMCLVHFVGF